MTNKQKAIILTSMIGTILSEYDDTESTKAVQELKFVCQRFMFSQSGTVQLPFKGMRIIDAKKYKNFLHSVMIGDRIWKNALDRYAKQSITIEAVSIVTALYEFDKNVLTHISNRKMDAFKMEAKDGNEDCKRAGYVIGGFLRELLAKEMGIKINGRLMALKNKVENGIIDNPEGAKERGKRDAENIKEVA